VKNTLNGRPVRRLFLALLGTAIPALAFAQAQSQYPVRPIRLVVAAAPSGGADQTARAIQLKLGQELGQSIVIDNRAGASGVIGVDVVAKAPPDGYTLLLYTSSHMSFPAVVANLPFNLERDLVPITTIDTQPAILVLHPGTPARTMKELAQFGKEHPGLLNYASGGAGTTPHIAGELFKLAGGFDMTHIPYKGTGAVWTDLLSGRTQMMFVGPLAVTTYIDSGQLRPIAIASTKRSPLYPNVPTAAESGFPTVVAGTWYGLAAPAGTPQPIIDRIHAAAAKVVRSPDLNEKFVKMGVEVGGIPQAEFRTLVRDEISRVTKALQSAGIKPE
jgi:tripartite-type tricarboxylate transporter receptor subunit TctC